MKNPEELGSDLKPGLYLVSTPIGNLGDITLRALEVLKSVDVILCEDKRVSAKLLNAYNIKGRLSVYNDHSGEEKRQEIIAKIDDGKRYALLSDAGAPLVCDPGYKLVRDCYERGLYVTCLPGANAPLSALQLSAMESDAFSFLGFLPSKDKARCDFLKKWTSAPGVLICFETAPRLLASLQSILTVLGERDVAVVREITKMFEEVKRDSVSSLISFYEEEGAPKGEIVLVISAAQAKDYSEDDIKDMIRIALKTMRNKEAASFVADQTGLKKSDLYDLALKVSKDE